MEITVALAQMQVAAGRPETNYEAARTLAARAAVQGADLMLLPELWPTGYDLGRALEMACALDAGPYAWMSDTARSHRMWVAGTALERNPAGRPFSTAALFGPQGELRATYRKVHLFPPMGDSEHMSPGTALPVFDLPWGRTALAICYDLRFPELWRSYMLAGARMVLIAAEWPERRVEHWRVLLRARAIENQFFVVGCNRAGSDRDGEFGGHSAVVDPWGRVLVEGGAEPGLFLARLDLDEVGRCRSTFPWLSDRRPEVYEHAGA